MGVSMNSFYKDYDGVLGVLSKCSVGVLISMIGASIATALLLYFGSIVVAVGCVNAYKYIEPKIKETLDQYPAML